MLIPKKKEFRIPALKPLLSQRSISCFLFPRIFITWHASHLHGTEIIIITNNK